MHDNIIKIKKRLTKRLEAGMPIDKNDILTLCIIELIEIIENSQSRSN